MSPRSIAACVTVMALLGPPVASVVGAQTAPVIVPLVNPPGGKPGAQPQGLFRKVVTARGFEVDDGRAGLHSVKALGVTNQFTP